MQQLASNQTVLPPITGKLPRIYFYCCPEPDNLQDDIVQLAEGLAALGIPFYASANYWLKSTTPGDYLFKATPEVAPNDCDVVVLPYTWFNWVRIGRSPVRRPIPAGLFAPGRAYQTVYMDTNDGYRTVAFEPEFRKFDIIFRAKYNQRFYQPANFKPWNHGLSGRIIRATAGAPPMHERSRRILFSFGASHGCIHQARVLAGKIFKPRVAALLTVDETADDLRVPPRDDYDRLMWEQTTRRHSAAYYQRLKNSLAVACFCGQIVPSYPLDATWYTTGGRRARLMQAVLRAASRVRGGPDRLIQWDSWRFWECLAAGCAAFNFDLEKYGVRLPVMPVNGTHYLGVDLDHFEPLLEKLRADPAIFERVGREGRQWALQHYAPRPTAIRFLRTLGFPVFIENTCT